MRMKFLGLIVLLLVPLFTYAQNDFTLTPNLQLKKPKLGSTNWGTYVNANFDSLDSAIGSIKGGYVDLPYNPTLTYDLATGNTFVTVLNGAVTSSTVAGTPTIGQFIYLITCQNVSGSNSYQFPLNFAIPLPSITQTPLGCTGTSWQWTSLGQWVNVGGGVSAAVGCTPSGPSGSLQKNVLGACAQALLSDDGSTTTNAGALSVTGTTSITGATTLLGNLVANLNAQFGGPNPYFDIMKFGGYFEPSNVPVTTTGSINSGSAALTLASAQNFANGQGVVVQMAGFTPTARNASFPAVPAVASVTPFGVTNGGTTYNYQFVLEDYFGGLTAAGTQGSTTTGAATLGVNTVALTGVVRTSGIETFTCSVNCNAAPNSQIQVSGFAGAAVNGTVVVASIPTSTTFTVNAQGLPDYTESASGTLSVRACNAVKPGGSLAQESVILRTWIYRNNTRVGVAPGQDPFFMDCNQGTTAPSYVPTSAPLAAQVGYLPTTIVAGGGTTTLTLANVAGTTVSGQTVQHDNSLPLIAAYTAAFAAHGGIVRIPVIPVGGFNTFPFNATTNLATISNPSAAAVRLEVSTALLNQPLIPPIFSEIVGIPQASTSFQYSPLGFVGGTAQPLILINKNTSNSVAISRIKFSPSGIGASSIVFDQVVGGGGAVGFILNDNGYDSNNASPVVIKGGFDFWFTHGVCATGGTERSQWYAHPCIELTNASTYLSNTATQVPGRIKIYDMNFQGGTAIQQDNLPSFDQPGTFVNGQLNLISNGILHESNAGPTIRIALGYGNTQAFGYGLDMTDTSVADPANGTAQPLVELTGTTGFNGITLRNNKGGGNPVIDGGGSGASPVCLGNVFFVGCGQTTNYNLTGSISTLDGGQFGLINNGSMGYFMSTPAAPA